MKAIEAMIVWTPNREPYRKTPMRGKIAVTKIPESAEIREYPMSVGACDLSWQEADDEGRIIMMQRYFTEMIHRDFLDEDEVYSALSEIDEFRGMRFSNEKSKDDP